MANEPAIRYVPVSPDMYHQMVDLDHTQSEHWDEKTLQYRFKNKDIVGYAALVDGLVAGYVIYQRDEEHHQNSILKFTLNHQYMEHAPEIQELLLALVKQDMSPDGRNHIVLYTDNTDEDTLGFFKRSHGEFKRLNAAGSGHVMLIYEMPKTVGMAGSSIDTYSIDTGGIPGGFGSSIVSIPPMDGLSFGGEIIGGPNNIQNNTPPASMDGFGGFSFSTNNLPDTDTPEWASAQQEPEPSTPAARKLTKVEMIQRAREKLTEMTGMEWETVTMDKRGKWVATHPQQAGDEDVFLQSASKIADPKAALNALYKYLGEKPLASHAGKLEKSAQVVVPVSLIRPIHLSLGAPRQLADAFVPASTQLRFQPSEAVVEPGRG